MTLMTFNFWERLTVIIVVLKQWWANFFNGGPQSLSNSRGEFVDMLCYFPLTKIWGQNRITMPDLATKACYVL
jgi:hypothetical protein